MVGKLSVPDDSLEILAQVIRPPFELVKAIASLVFAFTGRGFVMRANIDAIRKILDAHTKNKDAI